MNKKYIVSFFVLCCVMHSNVLGMDKNIDRQDKDGNTQLHRALYNFNKSDDRKLCCKVFTEVLINDPNPFLKNNAGKTPRQIAREDGLDELKELLQAIEVMYVHNAVTVLKDAWDQSNKR